MNSSLFLLILSLFFCPLRVPFCRYSLTNSVYKSLQDNNEDQCIVMLGETGSGKTENCRMIVMFLSRISGRFVPLQRQRSSNSITSFKSSPNSCSSTPKHKSSAPANSVFLNSRDEKSSCFKSDGVRSKKVSRVEFDFSYQKCNDGELKAGDSIKFCPKHNCCNQIQSSSSSNASNPIDIPKRKNSAFQLNDIPTTSKSFTIYETMNRVHNNKTTARVPNCLDSLPDHRQMQNKCESLDLTIIGNQSMKERPRPASDMSVSLDETVQVTKTSERTRTAAQQNQLSYNKSSINLDNFKSAKRKVPTKNLSKFSTQLNNFEMQTMKERIAQAEIFLDAMGCASIVQNRDSSRYVSHCGSEAKCET
jgi:myosin I